MERVLKKNQELEGEVERLKEELAHHTLSISPAHTNSHPHLPVLVAGSSNAQKSEPDWMPKADTLSCSWPAAGLPTHMIEKPPVLQVYSADNQVFATTSRNYDEPEDSQQLYNPTAIPVWDDMTMFGPKSSQNLTDSTPAWAPFHPSLSRPSRFADLQPSGFSNAINTNAAPYSNPNTEANCWQSQPSVYAWQISTKLKAPVTHVDHLMISVIQTQRHLQLTSDSSGEDLIGPEFPSVHVLFDQTGFLKSRPLKPPSTLIEVMDRYNAVLSNRGIALIPEKIASFMCMYRFVQWQIQPSYTTFQTLHDWQAPQIAQLTIPHPAWMDLPPWPKFREKIIQNQERYDNAQFQNDYATNLSVNFPFDPMKAVVFEEGQIKVSKIMEKHLSNLANMSMKKPFADKYPEFAEHCQFDKV